MRNLRRNISKVLMAIGVFFVAVSIYCFWNAYQIRPQQIQKAGNDPFVMVFSDKFQPEDAGTNHDEMIKLNNQRLRRENTGWYLIIGGVGLLAATSVMRSWRRKSIALGIVEKR